MINCIVISACAIVALMRLVGVHDTFFKDIAHVVCGVVLGGWIFSDKERLVWYIAFLVLIIVECLCAFVIYPMR